MLRRCWQYNPVASPINRARARNNWLVVKVCQTSLGEQKKEGFGVWFSGMFLIPWVYEPRDYATLSGVYCRTPVSRTDL